MTTAPKISGSALLGIEAERDQSGALPQPIDWPTFWATDHKAEDWLLEPVLPRGRSVATYAPSKTGKSEPALFLAACLATGRRVLDRPEGSPVDVVYLDLEMTETDLFERLDDMGFGPETDLSHLHYYLLPSLPPLDTPDGGTMLLAIARLHNAALVIIDTTGRAIAGEENSADTFRLYHQFTGQPLRADGRTVWRFDHAGKDLTRGQRGTSAKNDDVDLVWLLSRSDNGTRLHATHRRQGWIPEYVDLIRLEDPLRYELAAESWPEGTATLAGQLDKLDIPLGWGGKRVRRALRDAGQTARNNVIAAAIRYRKRAGTPSGTPSQQVSGTPFGDTLEFRYGDTLGDTLGHPATGDGGVCPPLMGDTPQPRCWKCGSDADRYDLDGERMVCEEHAP
jgi:hypothetical protein